MGHTGHMGHGPEKPKMGLLEKISAGQKTLEKKTGPEETKNQKPCPVCGSHQFWVDAYNELHCGGCEPPVSAAIIRKIITVEPTGAKNYADGWNVRSDGVIYRDGYGGRDWGPAMGENWDDWWTEKTSGMKRSGKLRFDREVQPWDDPASPTTPVPDAGSRTGTTDGQSADSVPSRL